MNRKDLRQIKCLLKRGENLYYNRFDINRIVITNDWDTIRRYNHLGKFPRWTDYIKYCIEDLDFESLNLLLEEERKREVELYVELLFRLED